MKPTIADLLANTNDNTLPHYAWPGGYPIVYITNDNQLLCPDCATKSLLDPDEWDDWKPSEWFIHYEGPPEYCGECNAEIESAYGDPAEIEPPTISKNLLDPLTKPATVRLSVDGLQRVH